jgi:hypothetical protein
MDMDTAKSLTHFDNHFNSTSNHLLSFSPPPPTIHLTGLGNFGFYFFRGTMEKKALVKQKLKEAQQDFEILPLSKPGATLFGVHLP